VIDHNAFTGQGLVETVGKLKARGLSYDLGRLPGYGTWQLFFLDPNGAKVEIDFDPAEPAPA
jgi:catechol 2,3-dioxygenase-like lactoylglutathione lyase family enzyme